MKWISNAGMKCWKWAAALCMLLLSALLVYFIVRGMYSYQTTDFFANSITKLEKIFVCIATFVLCSVSCIFASIYIKRAKDKMQKSIFTFFILLILLGQSYFLFCMQSLYKWDAGFVMGAATSLVEHGEVAKEAFYYLSVYPNQNAFVALTAGLVKIALTLGIPHSLLPVALNIVNTIAIDVAVIFIVLIWCEILRERSFKRVNQILVLIVLNPFLYLGVSYYYTLTLSLPFTMGFIYCIYKVAMKWNQISKKKSVILLVAGGALVGYGYVLRATAIIPIVAALICAIYMLLKNANTRLGIIKQIGLLCLSAILVMGITNTASAKFIGIDTKDTAFPTSHWLMMSLTYPGGHNAEDEAYTASFETAKDKKAAVQVRIKEKIKEMTPKDWVELLSTKAYRTFGDGTNGYRTFLTETYQTDGLYDVVYGNRSDLVLVWHQAYHLFLLLGMLICSFKLFLNLCKRKEIALEHFFLLLVLFGAILFYLLWEASEQYSIPFFLCMILIAGAGYEKVCTKMMEHNSRKKVHRSLKVLQIVLLSISILGLAFAGYRFHKFCEDKNQYTHPIVAQIMGNQPYAFESGAKYIQTFHTAQPFNQCIIQWRNPKQQDNQAIYKMRLIDEEGVEYFTTKIEGYGTGYEGAGIYNFNTVNPERDKIFAIEISKISGNAEENLEFVTYDMGTYDAYPGGDLYTLTDDKEVKQSRTLMFAISKQSDETYTIPPKYVIFVIVTFLIFLFFANCCKIVGNIVEGVT